MPAGFQTRIVGHGEANPADLIANPENWRTHPPEQRAALRGALGRLGWLQTVIVNQRTGLLLDGHLRVELAAENGQSAIPVTYVDLSEDEARLALVTLDPVAELAGLNAEGLDALLTRVGKTDDAGVDTLLAGLRARVDNAFMAGDFGDVESDTGLGAPKAPTITTQLVFDSEADLEAWYAWVKLSRAAYPDVDTTASRLLAHLKAHPLP